MHKSAFPGALSYAVSLGLVAGLNAADLVVDQGDPVALVKAAIARGEKTIRVPKGKYFIGTEDTTFFRLSGLKDVTLDFGGAELICGKRTRYVGLDHCTNCVVKNAFFDMDPLPYVQGVIEKVLPDDVWEVRVLEDYAQSADGPDQGDRLGGVTPKYGDGWPFQVYDRETLETKTWMRAFRGFRMERIGAGLYRVSGGDERKGAVGDYCVWRAGETARKADVFGIHLDRCRGCRVENVTMYTSWGVAFNEHFSSASVWKNCHLMRRPPETDVRRHSVPRLRSGAHDAFNSRMAEVGPRLENCSFAYHCDDSVNICGYYAVVTETEGKTARILYKGAARYGQLLFADDTLEIMTKEGETKADRPKLLAIRNDAPQTPEELAYLKTLKLWMGQAEICTDGARIEIDRPDVLRKGDLVIAENRQGNGWALVNCSFGPNRAFGLRIRASHGLVENCTFRATQGAAAFIGPEYEWFEGGFGNDILFRNNRFIGYENRERVVIGGRAAYGKTIPASAHVGVREETTD